MLLDEVLYLLVSIRHCRARNESILCDLIQVGTLGASWVRSCAVRASPNGSVGGLGLLGLVTTQCDTFDVLTVTGLCVVRCHEDSRVNLAQS